LKKIKTAGRALEILGGAVDQVIPYYFPGEKGRNVVVVSKREGNSPQVSQEAGYSSKKNHYEC